MKASIVILNWKGKYNDCLEAIESAIAQTYQDKEIIFVDNGSHDDTLSLLKEKFPDLNYVELSDNLGVTGGRNRGAAASTGDLIFFLENDGAWATNNVVTEAINFFQIYPHLGILYTAVTGYETGIKDPTVDSYPRIQEDILISSSFRGGAAVIRKNLFNKIGGYPDDYFRQCEEKYFSMFTYDLGYYIAYAPYLTMRHKGSDYQGKNSVVSWYNCINDFKNIIRHHPNTSKYLLIFVKAMLWSGRFLRNGRLAELKRMHSQLIYEILNNTKYKKIKKETISFIEALNCGLIKIKPFNDYANYTAGKEPLPSPFIARLSNSLQRVLHEN